MVMAMISDEALVRSRSFWLAGLCPDPDPGPLRTYLRTDYAVGATYVLTHQLLHTKTETETYERDQRRKRSPNPTKKKQGLFWLR